MIGSPVRTGIFEQVPAVGIAGGIPPSLPPDEEPPSRAPASEVAPPLPEPEPLEDEPPDEELDPEDEPLPEELLPPDEPDEELDAPPGGAPGPMEGFEPHEERHTTSREIAPSAAGRARLLRMPQGRPRIVPGQVEPLASRRGRKPPAWLALGLPSAHARPPSWRGSPSGPGSREARAMTLFRITVPVDRRAGPSTGVSAPSGAPSERADRPP
jgi:hypothetical protein